MLTDDLCGSTTMLQGVNHCVNGLLKGKLWSSMLQILCTYGCVLIGQVQLLKLWFTRQIIGHYVQRSLPIQYSNGQLIHPLKPMHLMSTKVQL